MGVFSNLFKTAAFPISAVTGLAGSIFGGISAGKARRQANNVLNQQQAQDTKADKDRNYDLNVQKDKETRGYQNKTLAQRAASEAETKRHNLRDEGLSAARLSLERQKANKKKSDKGSDYTVRDSYGNAVRFHVTPQQERVYSTSQSGHTILCYK